MSEQEAVSFTSYNFKGRPGFKTRERTWSFQCKSACINGIFSYYISWRMLDIAQIFFVSKQGKSHAHRTIQEFMRVKGNWIRFFNSPEKRPVFIYQKRWSTPGCVNMKICFIIPGDLTQGFEIINITGFSCTGYSDYGDYFCSFIVSLPIEWLNFLEEFFNINPVIHINRNVYYIWFSYAKDICSFCDWVMPPCWN